MQTICRVCQAQSLRPALPRRLQHTVASQNEIKSSERSPFLPHKMPGPSKRWQRPRFGARRWKELFIASNYGQDFQVSPGPKGKAEKLIRREELRKEAAASEATLFDLAKQHFKPEQLATARQNKRPTEFDRKAYLEQRGPYKGRNVGTTAERAFKGHRWEARQRERKQEVAGRMAKMGAQIAEAKRVSGFPGFVRSAFIHCCCDDRYEMNSE